METKPDPASALEADPDELADCLEVFGDGAAAAAGGVLVAAGGVPELDPALLAWVALVPEPEDPFGFLGVLGIVPVFRPEPAEIGGEFALIKIVEFLPKHTLSLGLGIQSPVAESDVALSLGPDWASIASP